MIIFIRLLAFCFPAIQEEIIAILITIILGCSLLSPAHILWINLVTDTFPALALGVELEERNLMARVSRDNNTPLLGKSQWLTVGFIGLYESLITLSGLYDWN